MQPSQNQINTFVPCIIEFGSKEYRSMCELRNEILRKPIGLILTETEKNNDKKDILLCVMENENVVACCILTEKNPKTVQLRQMAVAEKYQLLGIGKMLLHFAEKIALENHFSEIFMHARKTALDFYKKNGYSIIGQEFTEVGIPHFEMIKKI